MLNTSPGFDEIVSKRHTFTETQSAISQFYWYFRAHFQESIINKTDRSDCFLEKPRTRTPPNQFKFLEILQQFFHILTALDARQA
jgi:hypothetical protein